MRSHLILFASALLLVGATAAAEPSRSPGTSSSHAVGANRDSSPGTVSSKSGTDSLRLPPPPAHHVTPPSGPNPSYRR